MSRLPFITACTVLVASFVGCAASRPAIFGSGNIEREERTVSDFKKVSLSGSGELMVQQGDQEELIIETDDNLMSFIQTEVHGSELVIGWIGGIDPRPSRPVRFLLTVKNLESISLSGSANLTTEEFAAEKLSVSISGSAEANFKEMKSNELTVSISGSGKVIASGSANRFSVKIAGSGEIKAKQFEAKNVSVSVAGSGDADVWATDKLDVSVAGSGDVRYKGEPSVKQSVAGSGTVSKLK